MSRFPDIAKWTPRVPGPAVAADPLEEVALRESEAMFRGVLETAADGVLVVNAAGTIILANPMAERMFGYASAELPGMAIETLVPESRRAQHARHVERYRDAPEPRAMGTIAGVAGRRKDGSEFPADISISPFRARDGLLITAVVRDISERKRAEAELRLRERAIESSSNGIMISDALSPGHPIVYINRAFERMTGYAASETIGRNGRFLLGSDLGQVELEAVRTALREKCEGSALLRCYRKDGSVFWSELAVAPVHDEAGRVTHFISVMTDVTEHKLYEAQLELQATHDVLTGLASRALLKDRMEQGLARAARAGDMLVVALIDLDRFLVVNEILGHDCGDRLLRLIAQRLRACVREGDTAARLAGNQFVLALQGIASVGDATIAAQRILHSIAQPVTLDGSELAITASIGLSISFRDGDTPDQLLKSAGAAMHRAKRDGGNRLSFVDQEMNARAEERLALELDLRRALERNELLLHYQPKIDLRSGCIRGVEALVRWQHPDKGLIEPGRFIPQAEESGLIVPIGEWVLAAACAQNAAWQRSGFPAFSVAVNLSLRQFRESGLLAAVRGALAHSGLEARWLELEITESMLMENGDEVVRTLQQIRDLGVSLALDDFGKGYSSLTYLKRLPIDSLKIDRSFVRDITTDPDDATIAKSVIGLAHGMHLRVTAEGVETEAQLYYLRAHACDEMQGYYFSQPLAADGIEGLLTERRRLDFRADSTDERTLLLLDDEPYILNALRRVFRQAGYRVLAASDPYEAFDLLARNKVQVVMSDQRMPLMNGTEFLNRVKEIHPETVRIVLSGYTDLQAVTDAINKGAIYRFLTKPWDDDELRANIREAFARYYGDKR